jgi:hypothetical protein
MESLPVRHMLFGISILAQGSTLNARLARGARLDVDRSTAEITELHAARSQSASGRAGQPVCKVASLEWRAVLLSGCV